MIKWFSTLIALGLLIGCCGQGERQVRRLERYYGKPMKDILKDIHVRKPTQIESVDKDICKTGEPAPK